jgi:nucleotide-binding universal stress UspA family protein
MKKVLIALDFDPTAELVAEAGYALAKSMNAQAILLHVTSDSAYYSSLNYSPVMGFDGFYGLDPIQTGNVQALMSSAEDYLEKSKKHLGDETIQTVVKSGMPGETIVNTASELNADIIVMGTHSRSGLEKILVGSVAENVLHNSSIPLFIVPTKTSR